MLEDFIENVKQLKEYFNEVEDFNYILKGRVGYSIHWLKSIFSFFTEQYLDSFLCIQSTIDLLKKQKETFRENYLNQLYDNAKYFMAKAMINTDFSINLKQFNDIKLTRNLRKIIQMSNSERLNFVEFHKATAVLQTTDNKVNFPIL